LPFTAFEAAAVPFALDDVAVAVPLDVVAALGAAFAAADLVAVGAFAWGVVLRLDARVGAFSCSSSVFTERARLTGAAAAGSGDAARLAGWARERGAGLVAGVAASEVGLLAAAREDLRGGMMRDEVK
jgi:hypothetical protein